MVKVMAIEDGKQFLCGTIDEREQNKAQNRTQHNIADHRTAEHTLYNKAHNKAKHSRTADFGKL